MASSRGDRAATLAVALLAALAIVAGVVCFDGSVLPEVTRFRDDAYYYFVFARSLVHGEGPCVTPGVPTSGVHALWAALLTAITALRGDQGVILGAQHLGLGLHVLTAVGVFLVAGRTRLAAATACLYAANPFLLAEAQNGQETALGCALALGLCALRRSSTMAFTLVGVLAVLSRSDLVFLLAALAVARAGFRLRAAVPLLVALAGYALVNFVLTGGWLQDSASPIPWLFRQHFLRTEPDLAAHLRHFWWHLRPCLLGGPYGVAGPVWGAVLVAVTLGFLRGWWRSLPLALTILGLAVGARDVEVPLFASVLVLSGGAVGASTARMALAMLLGFAALVALHLVVRGYPRDYYFAPLAVLGAVMLPALRRREAWAALGLAAACTVVELAGPRVEQPWQEQMAMAGCYLREVLPAGEPVGSFNSGILAFHDPGPVLNLDGVVNAPAFAALRRRELDAYLDGQRVRFLVDSAIQFRIDDPWPHASGAWFGAGFDPDRDLIEVARFVVPGLSEPFIAYWRRGRGDRPGAQAARVLGPAPGFLDTRAGQYVLWPAAGASALAVGRLDGTDGRRVLASVDRQTNVVLRVSAAEAGRYGLFETGSIVPILVVDL